ncbi:ferroxidase [Malassezia sp. CBS 17886]|nr:ferroxidase [Malassezia sp. CBS 17886]
MTHAENIARVRTCAHLWGRTMRHAVPAGAARPTVPARAPSARALTSALACPLAPGAARPRAPAAARPLASAPARSLTLHASEITPQEYNKRVDASLDALTAQLEEVLETTDVDALGAGNASEWDVEYATGVLTLRLGAFGTYVINKQPPSKQIWLSSPVSGPKRFDYDASEDVWFTHKDGCTHQLHALLNAELSNVFQQPLELYL